MFGNFGDFANRRTQKSPVCVSDTQALQANKVAIVFYAHSLFWGDLCRISMIYEAMRLFPIGQVEHHNSLNEPPNLWSHSHHPLRHLHLNSQPHPPNEQPPDPTPPPHLTPHPMCWGCSCNVSGQRLMGKIRLDLGPSVNTELHGVFVHKYL